MRRLTSTLVCFLLLGPPLLTVGAHDYWLMPETFHPASNSLLEVSFTASHTYFENNEVPDITKFGIFLINPAGQQIPLAYSRVEPKAAWASVPICGDGTYVIGAVTTVPDYYSMTTDGWKPGRKSELKNVVQAGKYFKSIKVFFTVGQSSDTYGRPLGHTIEMVPKKNPTTLKAGQDLPVLVLYQGKPVNNVPVFGIYERYKPKDHSDQPIQTKTDANGIATIKIDRAGKWVVFAKHQFETKENADTDYENYRPYMMFEVK